MTLGADHRLPLAFAIDHQRVTHRVRVYAHPDSDRIVDRLDRRTPVPLLGKHVSADGAIAAYRIGHERWVKAADLRVVRAASLPPRVRPDEKWIDVDLDSQLLVAYEGRRPVYATVISSGSRRYPSKTGLYRIWIKFSETDMSGQMGDDDSTAYSVSTVPWTQFYAKDLALHTAYWHDRFGEPRSHGCINLAPVDARFLYFWTDPDVPAGWSMANGIFERPGSVVRVRSADDPEPAPRGYAERVHQSRAARAKTASQPALSRLSAP